jgi:hypothetical protein
MGLNGVRSQKTSICIVTVLITPDFFITFSRLPIKLANWLIPWSRVLPEKLTGPQLLKKFRGFYGTWRFITAVTRFLRFFQYFVTWLIFLRLGVIRNSPNPQAWRPPVVGCPRLLIQYIHRYLPYLEAVPPCTTWGRAMPWWQGPILTVVLLFDKVKY